MRAAAQAKLAACEASASQCTPDEIAALRQTISDLANKDADQQQALRGCQATGFAGAGCTDVARSALEALGSYGGIGVSGLSQHDNLNQLLSIVAPYGITVESQARQDLAAYAIAAIISAPPGITSDLPTVYDALKGDPAAIAALTTKYAGTAVARFAAGLIVNPTATDAAAGGSFWSSTSTKTVVENAYVHWDKHRSEFPEYQNSVQYVQAAQDFVSNPPGGTLSLTRSNGDTVLYNPATNTFAVKAADGTPKTMFRPNPAQHGYATNLDYFSAQKR